jgi:hypothetical protein
MNNDSPNPMATTVRLAEYPALGVELLNRVESQRQLLSLAIIAIGTVFIAGTQNPNPTVGTLVILGYPVLCLCLAAGGGHLGVRVYQLGSYVRERIEKSLDRDMRDGCPLMSWASPRARIPAATHPWRRYGGWLSARN